MYSIRDFSADSAMDLVYDNKTQFAFSFGFMFQLQTGDETEQTCVQLASS